MRQPVALEERECRRDQRADHRQDVSDDQPVTLVEEGEHQGGNADRPRLDDRARTHRRPDVVAIGKRGKHDVRPGKRDDGDREQPVESGDLAVRVHGLRKGDQDRDRHQRAQQRDDERVPGDAGMRLVGVRELLRQPALQPERRKLRGELDDQDRISEAAERRGSVHSPGDEQERQPRRQPKNEAEEVDPPAAGERGKIGGRRTRLRFRFASMRGAPMLAPSHLNIERDVKLERGLGRRRHDGAHDLGGFLFAAFGHLEHQLVVHLQEHPHALEAGVLPAPRPSAPSPA